MVYTCTIDSGALGSNLYSTMVYVGTRDVCSTHGGAPGSLCTSLPYMSALQLCVLQMEILWGSSVHRYGICLYYTHLVSLFSCWQEHTSLHKVTTLTILNLWRSAVPLGQEYRTPPPLLCNRGEVLCSPRHEVQGIDTERPL